MKLSMISSIAIVAALTVQAAQAETLRLLTWGGYAPQEVIDLFEAETGHTSKSRHPTTRK